jgi:S-adenosylmethionine uptake transporter
MIGVVSSTNDVFMRFLGSDLHTIEIVFFRFFLSTIAVLPLMCNQGIALFKTKQPMMHVWRAVIGALALWLCCYGVNVMPLAENTAILFTMPLFFLPMAWLFLKEKVDSHRWIATIVGFLGLAIIIQPGTATFQFNAIYPIMAAVLFAFISIMAKKMIAKEHTYTLLFYFGLVSMLITLPFLFYVWRTPTLRELGFLIALGLGSNLIQVCLFRAYASVEEASTLSPFSYVEFFISAFFGYIFFNQGLKPITVFGAIMIFLSTLYMTISESKKRKRNNTPTTH